MCSVDTTPPMMFENWQVTFESATRYTHEHVLIGSYELFSDSLPPYQVTIFSESKQSYLI